MGFDTFDVQLRFGQMYQTALWARRNAAATRSFFPQAHRNRADWTDNRRLGDVCRNLGSGRREMAYSRSVRILSHYGNSLDHPIETAGKMDADRVIPGPLVTA